MASITPDLGFAAEDNLKVPEPAALGEADIPDDWELPEEKKEEVSLTKIEKVEDRRIDWITVYYWVIVLAVMSALTILMLK